MQSIVSINEIISSNIFPKPILVFKKRQNSLEMIERKKCVTFYQDILKLLDVYFFSSYLITFMQKSNVFSATIILCTNEIVLFSVSK